MIIIQERFIKKSAEGFLLFLPRETELPSDFGEASVATKRFDSLIRADFIDCTGTILNRLTKPTEGLIFLSKCRECDREAVGSHFPPLRIREQRFEGIPGRCPPPFHSVHVRYFNRVRRISSPQFLCGSELGDRLIIDAC